MLTSRRQRTRTARVTEALYGRHVREVRGFLRHAGGRGGYKFAAELSSPVQCRLNRPSSAKNYATFGFKFSPPPLAFSFALSFWIRSEISSSRTSSIENGAICSAVEIIWVADDINDYRFEGVLPAAGNFGSRSGFRDWFRILHHLALFPFTGIRRRLTAQEEVGFVNLSFFYWDKFWKMDHVICVCIFYFNKKPFVLM